MKYTTHRSKEEKQKNKVRTYENESRVNKRRKLMKFYTKYNNRGNEFSTIDK